MMAIFAWTCWICWGIAVLAWRYERQLLMKRIAALQIDLHCQADEMRRLLDRNPYR